MRFHSAVLLFSSISGLLSLDVLAAPIRIVVVEKVAISEADAFLRSVRIGHPGANPIPGVESVGGEPIRISGLSTSGDGLLHIARPVVNPTVAIPMTPDAEFNILPFPRPNFGESYDQSLREFCQMESQTWKARFHSISNWVREVLGLPPIRNLFSPCPSGILERPKPIAPSPALTTALPYGLKKPCHNTDTFNGNALEVAGPRRRPGMWAARHRPKTFVGRLRRALYSLTPWEGRALAFVVGCGLGVLIRMIYVFIVLGVRALRCRNRSSVQLDDEDDEDEDESEQVVEGVILFDAGSIKAASQEDLSLYNEKEKD